MVSLNPKINQDSNIPPSMGGEVNKAKQPDQKERADKVAQQNLALSPTSPANASKFKASQLDLSQSSTSTTPDAPPLKDRVDKEDYETGGDDNDSSTVTNTPTSQSRTLQRQQGGRISNADTSVPEANRDPPILGRVSDSTEAFALMAVGAVHANTIAMDDRIKAIEDAANAREKLENATPESTDRSAKKLAAAEGAKNVGELGEAAFELLANGPLAASSALELKESIAQLIVLNDEDTRGAVAAESVNAVVKGANLVRGFAKVIQTTATLAGHAIPIITTIATPVSGAAAIMGSLPNIINVFKNLGFQNGMDTIPDKMKEIVEGLEIDLKDIPEKERQEVISGHISKIMEEIMTSLNKATGMKLDTESGEDHFEKERAAAFERAKMEMAHIIKNAVENLYKLDEGVDPNQRIHDPAAFQKYQEERERIIEGAGIHGQLECMLCMLSSVAPHVQEHLTSDKSGKTHLLVNEMAGIGARRLEDRAGITAFFYKATHSMVLQLRTQRESTEGMSEAAKKSQEETLEKAKEMIKELRIASKTALREQTTEAALKIIMGTLTIAAMCTGFGGAIVVAAGGLVMTIYMGKKGMEKFAQWQAQERLEIAHENVARNMYLLKTTNAGDKVEVQKKKDGWYANIEVNLSKGERTIALGRQYKTFQVGPLHNFPLKNGKPRPPRNQAELDNCLPCSKAEINQILLRMLADQLKKEPTNNNGKEKKLFSFSKGELNIRKNYSDNTIVGTLLTDPSWLKTGEEAKPVTLIARINVGMAHPPSPKTPLSRKEMERLSSAETILNSRDPQMLTRDTNIEGDPLEVKNKIIQKEGEDYEEREVNVSGVLKTFYIKLEKDVNGALKRPCSDGELNKVFLGILRQKVYPEDSNEPRKATFSKGFLSITMEDEGIVGTLITNPGFLKRSKSETIITRISDESSRHESGHSTTPSSEEWDEKHASVEQDEKSVSSQHESVRSATSLPSEQFRASRSAGSVEGEEKNQKSKEADEMNEKYGEADDATQVFTLTPPNTGPEGEPSDVVITASANQRSTIDIATHGLRMKVQNVPNKQTKTFKAKLKHLFT